MDYLDPTMLRRLSIQLALVLATHAFLPGLAAAQPAAPDDVRAMVQQIPKQCEEPARVLAEARLSKWRKSGKDVGQAFTDDPFKTVMAVMQQQCVSVQTVALLRVIKAAIPAADAVKMNLDAEIAKHMAIIERTL